MKNKRFLVVDDEPGVADFVRMVIELEGGIVVLAATAALASASLLADGPFDIMVLDLGLPDLSGWDLLASARELLASVHVVIFSAHLPHDAAERAKDAGVALMLLKPVAATTLRDALASVLMRSPGP